jgi:hypothetical protein
MAVAHKKSSQLNANHWRSDDVLISLHTSLVLLIITPKANWIIKISSERSTNIDVLQLKLFDHSLSRTAVRKITPHLKLLLGMREKSKNSQYFCLWLKRNTTRQLDVWPNEFDYHK